MERDNFYPILEKLQREEEARLKRERSAQRRRELAEEAFRKWREKQRPTTQGRLPRHVTGKNHSLAATEMKDGFTHSSLNFENIFFFSRN